MGAASLRRLPSVSELRSRWQVSFTGSLLSSPGATVRPSASLSALKRDVSSLTRAVTVWWATVRAGTYLFQFSHQFLSPASGALVGGSFAVSRPRASTSGGRTPFWFNVCVEWDCALQVAERPEEGLRCRARIAGAVRARRRGGEVSLSVFLRGFVNTAGLSK